jgi:hypothetical protein
VFGGTSHYGNLTVADGTAFGHGAGNASIAGTLGITGDVAVNTNKFTVNATSGNTLVAGTLAVTSDVSVNTNKFTVAASSGNTVVAGTLGVTGDVAVNTNKFTVAASSGNTAVAGTLSVTGNVSMDGFSANAASVNATGSVSIADNATASFGAFSSGLVLITEPNLTGGSALIAFANGAAHTIVWQNGSIFTMTATTASKMNVYISGGNLTVENKLGSTAPAVRAFVVKTS